MTHLKQEERMSSELRMYRLKLVSTFAPLSCVAVGQRPSTTAITTKIKCSIMRLKEPGPDDGDNCDPLPVYPMVEDSASFTNCSK